MVEYLLGNFMVNTGIISQEDLLRVLEIQDKSRMKIGVLAVMEGYMTNEQTRQVNFAQMMVDKKFGEIAIEKGFLSQKQVDELLEKQGNSYLVFIQKLIDENLCSVEEADAILHGFQIENGFTNEQMESFKNVDIDRIVEMYLPVGAIDYKELVIMAVKTTIRSIDRNAYIGHGYMTDSYDAISPVMQQLEGDNSISSGIADVCGGMCSIASVFGRMPFDQLDEDAQDACGEFLNCINGLYVSDERYCNQDYELVPPEIGEKNMKLCSDAIFVLPIYIKDKCFSFLVTDGMWNI